MLASKGAPREHLQGQVDPRTSSGTARPGEDAPGETKTKFHKTDAT